MASPKAISEEARKLQINSINNIELIGWDGHYKNGHSKAMVRCSIDGMEWSATVNSLVNRGTGCPKCGRLVTERAKRIPEHKRISQINSKVNIEFIGWHSKYTGNRTKAVVRCKLCKREWTATVNALIDAGTGCKKCSQVALSNSQRTASSERISQINSIYGIKFNSWSSGEYKNKNSKALVFCGSGHFWSASVTNLLGGGGCPYCAKYGYQLDKKGYLYALRSECGRYLKVGISNIPSRRHKELQKRTPFQFNLVEQISGDGAKIAELEKYFHGKYERAGFTGFDGCTEWIICTDELLKEIIEMGR